MARAAGDAILVDVKNRGARIPSHVLQAIFDPVVQFEAAKRNPGRPASLGLGLFIAREIAHAHGGTIEVDSSDDVTTFTISIPAQGAARRPDPAGLPQRPALA